MKIKFSDLVIGSLFRFARIDGTLTDIICEKVSVDHYRNINGSKSNIIIDYDAAVMIVRDRNEPKVCSCHGFFVCGEVVDDVQEPIHFSSVSTHTLR